MKTHVLLIAFLLAVACAPVSQNNESILADPQPDQAGKSSERLREIDELAQRYVDNGNFPGIVTIVARHGKIVHQSATGQYGLDNNKPMSMDTLFRIYSMTKPVTAVAAMILYEEGKFQMTDPVMKHLPEFRDQMLYKDGALVKPASPMTMGQLFTHTAGLTYGTTLDNPVDDMYAQAKLLQRHDLEEFVEELAKLPLRFEPGSRYHYSVSSDLLGAAVERISGQPLDQFFSERIFAPLGMTDTFFAVPPEKLERFASIHVWDKKNNTAIVVPPEHQRDFVDVSFFSGGGGLVSTAGDYQRFCQMIIDGGSLNGARILGPKIVQYMSANHLTPELREVGRGQYPAADFFPGQSMALGFGVITNPDITPAISSKGELSWGGIAGTQFWIDPKEGIVGVAMVQLFRSPWPLRFDIKKATYRALTESDSR